MRLIDADYLKNNGYRICKVGNGIFGLSDVSNEIPTAYDKENVVEQFREYQEELPTVSNWGKRVIETDLAINIVEKGGMK